MPAFDLPQARFLVVCFALLCSTSWAQPRGGVVVADQTLSQSELTRLLVVNRDRGEINIINCTITADNVDDDFEFAFDDYRDLESASGYQDRVSKTRIQSSITFTNCHFSPATNRVIQLSNLYFRGTFRLENCDGYGLAIHRSIFWNQVDVADVNVRYLEFQGCQFFESFRFSDVDITQASFQQSEFIRNQNSNGFGFQFEDNNKFYDLIVLACEFLDQSEKTAVLDSIVHEKNILRLTQFDAEHASISHSVFDCSVLLGEFAVEKAFRFEKNRYYGKVIFDRAPNVPSESSVLPFEELLESPGGSSGNEANPRVKIGIVRELPGNKYLFNRYDKDWEYAKDQVRPWVNTNPEEKIIPVYSKLLSIYDANSDINSYNLAFRQMKRIEKTASKVKWETNRQFIDWFRWKMDIFLERFSSYGTDPVLSLVNSFLVICAFALLYIVFPSEEDNLRFHNIQSAVYKYIAHFGEQQRQFLTADEIYNQEREAARLMKSQLMANMEKLPPVVSFFSMPFYYVSSLLAAIRYRIRSVIRFNIYQDWSSQSQRGRFRTSVVVSLNLLGFLLWGLFMRLVNGFTLSLNAFVTLGYGEIEAKGIARYFCVIEGLVGWFLLSIFSVSLISQILQ